IADRILDHRGRDAGPQTEAVGEVRGTVELAAAHVDGAGRGLAERDDARIETMDERAERQKVECAVLSDVQRVRHDAGEYVSTGPCRAAPASAAAGVRRRRGTSRDGAHRDGTHARPRAQSISARGPAVRARGWRRPVT